MWESQEKAEASWGERVIYNQLLDSTQQSQLREFPILVRTALPSYSPAVGV